MGTRSLTRVIPRQNGLSYDVVWWAYDKADKALEKLSDPVFAVDDDPSHINKFADAGIKTFWVCRNGGMDQEEYKLHYSTSRDYSNRRITSIETLADIPIGDYSD